MVQEHAPNGSDGDHGHLVPAARDALALSLEERLAWAHRDHWIGPEAARIALDAIGDLLRLPRTTTSPSLLLLGVSVLDEPVLRKLRRTDRAAYHAVRAERILAAVAAR